MPNNIINRLCLDGNKNDIKRLIERVKGKDSPLDFNKIIPMPKALDIEAGSRTNKGLAAYREFISAYTFDGAKNNPDLLNIPEKSENAFLRTRKDIKRDEWKLGKAAFQNQLRYGTPTWYEWRIANWGTKWSAYNVKVIDDKTIEFQTAWSHAMPVIQELAKQFPHVQFDYSWADEDLGMNVGKAEFEYGELVSYEFFAGQSKCAYELAAELWGLDLAEEGFVFDEEKQTYEFRDELAETQQMS